MDLDTPCAYPSFPNASFDVVTITASFGGISALQHILAPLPADFPATIIIQTHLKPNYPSALADILQRHTTLPVTWGSDGAWLSPSTVIIAPPGQHMQVTPYNTLTLTSWSRLNYARPRADGLFESVAIHFKARAIGVVLTGYLNDGAQGAQSIRQQGGCIIVQDPKTAEAPGMPRATLQTGYVDFVLSLHAIPAALIALVMVSGAAQFFAVPLNSPQPYRDALLIWGR